MRSILTSLLQFAGGVAVVVGVAQWSTPAGVVSAGVLAVYAGHVLDGDA